MLISKYIRNFLFSTSSLSEARILNPSISPSSTGNIIREPVFFEFLLLSTQKTKTNVSSLNLSLQFELNFCFNLLSLASNPLSKKGLNLIIVVSLKVNIRLSRIRKIVTWINVVSFCRVKLIFHRI